MALRIETTPIFHKDYFDCSTTTPITVITKLLKRKYEDFTNHVSRQQSSSATGVNVNVDDIVNVDNPVEME